MIYFDWDSGNNEDKNRLGLFQQQHKKKKKPQTLVAEHNFIF